jgi:hypothetical protein
MFFWNGKAWECEDCGVFASNAKERDSHETECQDIIEQALGDLGGGDAR